MVAPPPPLSVPTRWVMSEEGGCERWAAYAGTPNSGGGGGGADSFCFRVCLNTTLAQKKNRIRMPEAAPLRPISCVCRLSSTGYSPPQHCPRRTIPHPPPVAPMGAPPAAALPMPYGTAPPSNTHPAVLAGHNMNSAGAEGL